jgi:hypothetical protein
MVNGTTPSHQAGITSWAYHITMWILVIAGMLGNVMVVVWRCSKRASTLSMLIISLAIADFCFCLHYLLQEVMLAESIFDSGRQSLYNVTSTEKQFCTSIN